MPVGNKPMSDIRARSSQDAGRDRAAILVQIDRCADDWPRDCMKEAGKSGGRLLTAVIQFAVFIAAELVTLWRVDSPKSDPLSVDLDRVSVHDTCVTGKLGGLGGYAGRGEHDDESESHRPTIALGDPQASIGRVEIDVVGGPEMLSLAGLSLATLIASASAAGSRTSWPRNKASLRPLLETVRLLPEKPLLHRDRPFLVFADRPHANSRHSGNQRAFSSFPNALLERPTWNL